MEEQVTEDVPEPSNAEEEGATPKCRADSFCVGEVGGQALEAIVGCEDAPSSAEEESATPRGRENAPCVGEGGVTSEGQRRFQAPLEFAKTSPALEGKVPQGKSDTPSREE